MDGQTDGRTDGQVENSIPLPASLAQRRYANIWFSAGVNAKIIFYLYTIALRLLVWLPA